MEVQGKRLIDADAFIVDCIEDERWLFTVCSIKNDSITNNVQALYEMRAIPSPTLVEAIKFCSKSNVGGYACQVQTRYGWCCDLCLEEELLDLYAKGVHTINSCCGHGNDALRAILVIGKESYTTMRDMRYEFLQNLDQGITMWRPKSNTISDIVAARTGEKADGDVNV